LAKNVSDPKLQRSIQPISDASEQQSHADRSTGFPGSQSMRRIWSQHCLP